MFIKTVSLLLVLSIATTAVASDQPSLETNKLTLLKKDRWLQSLLHTSRHKRQTPLKRPCPPQCNCNYESISCSDLIPACPECLHWSAIDFSHITAIKPHAFRDFHFAPDRTTHLIIYKLIDSSLAADVFSDLVVPENAQVEITFQYNSVVRFEPYTLRGLRLKANSSLIFNLPYTTQVVFVAKCFDGMRMQETDSKLIVRVLKSFSVRFVNDFISQGFFEYKQMVNNGVSSGNFKHLKICDKMQE